MNAEEFADMVRNAAPMRSGPYTPSSHYDPDGDCIEFFINDEPFVGERLDRWVTVYLDRRNREIVGSLIKGVHKLLERYPGMNIIDIKAGRVHLSHILRAPAWSSEDEVTVRMYKRLIDKADEYEMTAELAVAGSN